MNANFAAVPTSSRGPLHPGPARPFQPDHQPGGQPQRHDRHGHRRRHHPRDPLGPGALDPDSGGLILGGVAVGGGVGAVIARKVAMTSMPQLVAAFHSLVGMAACLVAVAAIYTPAAYGIVGATGHPPQLADRAVAGPGHRRGHLHRLGDRLRQAQRQYERRADPAARPPPAEPRHRAGIVALIVVLVMSGGQAIWAFWGIFALSLLIGVTLIIPIGGADMPVVVSMLNSYSGWAAAALGFTLENTTLIITGALVGSSGAILSYIMCKAMNRSFISVILGGFGAGSAAGRRPARSRPARSSRARPRTRPSS
jgi:NAD(P) transhydrogenase subunit beta